MTVTQEKFQQRRARIQEDRAPSPPCPMEEKDPQEGTTLESSGHWRQKEKPARFQTAKANHIKGTRTPVASDLWTPGRAARCPRSPEGNQDTAPKNSISQLSGDYVDISDLQRLEYVLFLGEQLGLCFSGTVHRETALYGT